MKKNKLCMILYKLCIKLSVLKSSLLEAFSKKDAPQTWSKPTGEEPYIQKHDLNKGVLRILGAHQWVGKISIVLQSSFVEIALLHGFSAVGLLHVCKTSFLGNISGGLLLNTDNFKISVLL